eukprot:2441077-Alexandrium_andersonii.AAC.1
MAMGTPPYAIKLGMRPVNDKNGDTTYQMVCAHLRVVTPQGPGYPAAPWAVRSALFNGLSLIHISEPTRLALI